MQSLEAVISRVRYEVTRDCEVGRFDPCPPAETVDRVVAVVVSEFWESRVQTFVSLLALRAVRVELSAGTANLRA